MSRRLSDVMKNQQDQISTEIDLSSIDQNIVPRTTLSGSLGTSTYM